MMAFAEREGGPKNKTHPVVSLDLFQSLTELEFQDGIGSKRCQSHVFAHGHELRPGGIVQSEFILKRLRKLEDLMMCDPLSLLHLFFPPFTNKKKKCVHTFSMNKPKSRP